MKLGGVDWCTLKFHWLTFVGVFLSFALSCVPLETFSSIYKTNIVQNGRSKTLPPIGINDNYLLLRHFATAARPLTL